MKTHPLCAILTTLILAFTLVACPQDKDSKPDSTVVETASGAPESAKVDYSSYSNKLKVTTSVGAFTLELLPDITPVTVENFKKWASQGFYEGTIFHRVMPGFMIQGGGHLPDMSMKPFVGSVTNEADVAKSKGLINRRGTISMAYATGSPFGASVQFFINVGNNPNLDFKERSQSGFGHCPFGKVIQGMDVVDKISKVKTQTMKALNKNRMQEYSNVPVQPIAILKIEEV
jgi:cyclophilin family peptidyl-prolyl cis-trans isomerase